MKLLWELIYFPFLQSIPAFSSEIKVENKSISILTESVFALQAAMIADTSLPTLNYNHLTISNTSLLF